MWGYIWFHFRFTGLYLTLLLITRKELRERNKVLWSDGQQKKKWRKNKKASAAALEQQASTGGGGDTSTFRLVVTGDGNAVLERAGVGVVWKALDQ